jgi:hypothetical protein
MGAMKKKQVTYLGLGFVQQIRTKVNVLFNEQFGTLSLDSKPS